MQPKDREVPLWEAGRDAAGGGLPGPKKGPYRLALDGGRRHEAGATCYKEVSQPIRLEIDPSDRCLER